MKKYRNGKKLRQLWDGRYQPFYELTSLDDFNCDFIPIDSETFIKNWWEFLDYCDNLLK